MPLLRLRTEALRQAAALTKDMMRRAAWTKPAVLMTIPGIGAVSAVTYVATIDIPRFAKSRSIGAYIGLSVCPFVMCLSSASSGWRTFTTVSTASRRLAAEPRHRNVCLLVVGVTEIRGDACAGLNEYLMAELGEKQGRRWCHRDPRFPCECFF